MIKRIPSVVPIKYGIISGPPLAWVHSNQMTRITNQNITLINPTRKLFRGASSSFWRARDTGFRKNRSKVASRAIIVMPPNKMDRIDRAVIMGDSPSSRIGKATYSRTFGFVLRWNRVWIVEPKPMQSETGVTMNQPRKGTSPDKTSSVAPINLELLDGSAFRMR